MNFLFYFRNERSQTNLLRQQQDEAYQESLLADQEKERVKREQQQALDKEQERIREEEQERQRQKEVISTFLKMKIAYYN